MADSRQTLRARIEIDSQRLDREWVEQPTKHFDAAVQHAEYLFRLAKAKCALEVEEARVARDVRATKTEEKRLTEAAIAEAVVLHPTVHTLRMAVAEAGFRANTAKALVEASEQRMWALKTLSGLPGLVERGGTELEEERLMARLARQGADRAA